MQITILKCQDIPSTQMGFYGSEQVCSGGLKGHYMILAVPWLFWPGSFVPRREKVWGSIEDGRINYWLTARVDSGVFVMSLRVGMAGSVPFEFTHTLAHTHTYSHKQTRRHARTHAQIQTDTHTCTPWGLHLPMCQSRQQCRPGILHRRQGSDSSVLYCCSHPAHTHTGSDSSVLYCRSHPAHGDIHTELTPSTFLSWPSESSEACSDWISSRNL